MFGLLTRRERWGLSWRGWLAAALLAGLTAWLVVVRIHPFLAVTDRVDAQVLVVEGWVHRFAIRAAVAEFRTGAYARIYTTGGPVDGDGGYTNDYNTAASVGAGLLRQAGVAPDLIQVVPARLVGRDRTYASAAALRDWLCEHQVAVTAINIVTEAPHARRTRLLFQEAFGPGVRVGIIAAQNPDYDPAHWWRTSEGVREVIGEGLAYLYARFLFFPPRNQPDVVRPEPAGLRPPGS